MIPIGLSMPAVSNRPAVVCLLPSLITWSVTSAWSAFTVLHQDLLLPFGHDVGLESHLDSHIVAVTQKKFLPLLTAYRTPVLAQSRIRENVSAVSLRLPRL